MKRIRPDDQRLVRLAGVSTPIHRPVDIDQSLTGFASLRSLRIYSFPAGSVIDGHAEEDEVMIVILAGSVLLSMSEGEVEGASPRFTLRSAGNPEGIPRLHICPPVERTAWSPKRTQRWPTLERRS